MQARVVVVAVFLLLTCLLCVQTYRLEMVRRSLPEGKLGGDSVGVVAARGDIFTEGAREVEAGVVATMSAGADIEGDGGGEPAEATGLEAYLEALDGRIREKLPAGGGAGDAAGGVVAAGGGSVAGEGLRGRGKAKAGEQAARLAQRAQDAVERGDYTEALSLLQDALAADPSSRDAYQGLAGLYQKMGLSEDALSTYAAWSRNRPNDAAPCYQQARLLESLGRDGEALAQLQKFQALSSGELSALPMAASLYRSLKMPGEEGAVLSEWASSVPNSPDARRALAQYYNRVGDKPGAAAEYQAVASMLPASATAHRDLAQAYQRLRQYPEAQQELMMALSLRPGDMQTRLQLGQVQRQVGDAAGALATYESVMAEAPGTPEAHQARRAISQVNRQLERGGKP